MVRDQTVCLGFLFLQPCLFPVQALPKLPAVKQAAGFSEAQVYRLGHSQTRVSSRGEVYCSSKDWAMAVSPMRGGKVCSAFSREGCSLLAVDSSSPARETGEGLL